MGFVGVAIPGPGLAKVEAAEELADKEDVGAVDDFRAEGRGGGELGVGDGRAEVGETAERLADVEQAGFGAFVGGEGVEFIVADGAKQDGVGAESQVESLLREGGPVRGDGDAAEEGFGEAEVVVAGFGDLAEDGYGFLGDLGADAVAGEDCDVQLHSRSLSKFALRSDLRCGAGTKS